MDDAIYCLYDRYSMFLIESKYEAALSCINKALRLAPTNEVYLQEKMNVLIELKRKSEVIECCKELFLLPSSH